MLELSNDIVDTILAACRAAKGEAATALSETLDVKLTLEVNESTTWSAANTPDAIAGSGLVFQFVVGKKCALGILPASTGLVPAWVAAPDERGAAKLSQLARELGELWLPETLPAEHCRVGHVRNLATLLAKVELPDDAPVVPMNLRGDKINSQMSLVWPAMSPQDLFAESQTNRDNDDEDNADGSRYHLPYRVTDYSELPPYARHLLKVSVPVVVRLVNKKQSIKEITELIPGAIISFDKRCDAPLELFVNNRLAAVGETVKVGERFGLQISDMVLPPEAFASVKKRG